MSVPPPSRSGNAQYDYLCKLLLIGDSGKYTLDFNQVEC